MNELRNAANAQYLVFKELNSNSTEIEYIERFKLDWDLYNGKALSEEAEEQFHL